MAVSNVHSSPSVRITPVPTDLLRFPPESLPTTLPPPSGELTLTHPFAIPADIYNFLLSVRVPITVILVYATLVTILNALNAKRNFKPWTLSTTTPFRAFVVAHNIFLALFSACTFLGLVNAVRVSLDGTMAEHGLVGAVDALCKINGPRGLGDAATFNSSTGSWGFTNQALKLGPHQLPDTTDIGRIWNEGLAFYGWLFYISKFYEVVDTLIILAKGRNSSFLQTYHHAGAIMCMWAGIRYMAPPIWMFVLVNSFIHVLMYLYYTATSLGIRVPSLIKQMITTMQIAQFVVGAMFAFAHLFVAYTIPVSVPYVYSFADLTSGLASDVSSAASVATATASAGLASWLKKIAFRAAGEEGLAENVRNEQGKPFGIDAIHAAKDLKAREEIRYRNELQMIHCTDTSGQVFAILINCFYLAPLTWLFVRFFIRSYTKRGHHQGNSSTGHLIEESGKDAAKAVRRELGRALIETPGSTKEQNDTRQPPSDGTRASIEKTRGSSEEAQGPNKEAPDSNKDTPDANIGIYDDRKKAQNVNNSSQAVNRETVDGNENTQGVDTDILVSDRDTQDVAKDTVSSNEDRQDVKGDKQDVKEDTQDVNEDTQDVNEDTQDANGDTQDVNGDTQDVNGDTQGPSHETEDSTGRQERGELAAGTENQDGEESNSLSLGENGGAPEDEEDEDMEKDDLEILDSAEAVKDVLDEGLDTADKFSKELENSKAG